MAILGTLTRRFAAPSPGGRGVTRKQSSKHPARLLFLHPLLLVILSFLVYANSLSGGFVWDDHLQIERNPTIRHLANIPKAFAGGIWSFVYSDQSGANRYYRPVQTVIFTVVYAVGGLSPFAYHFANVTIHALATILVYFICLEFGLTRLPALLAAALFAVHPVHTEAVSWIDGVGDLACGMFYFAALLTFLRYLNTRVVQWIWISSLFFLLALFSKEMGVTFPAIAGLLLFVRRKTLRLSPRTVAGIAAPYVLSLAIYGAARIGAVGSSVRSSIESDTTQTGVLDWTTMMITVLGRYIRYALAPYPLFAYHLLPLHLSDRMWTTAISGLLVAAAIVILNLLRKRIPEVVWWFAAFIVMLAPVLYFQGIGGGVFFAERYLYVPSLAFVALLASILSRLPRTYFTIATVALLSVFSVLATARNRDWTDEERFYRRTVELQPETVSFWTNLGEIHLVRNDTDHAQGDFETAVKHLTDPRFFHHPYDSYRAYLGLGNTAAKKRQFTEAKSHLNHALTFYADGDGAYTTLGGILINEDHDYAKGMALLDKAIRLNPTNELARDYMGVALFNQGQLEQAIRYFREALEINSAYTPASRHLEAAIAARRK